MVEARDLARSLVPEVLADRLLDRDLASGERRRLALDDHERNAVHEADDVRPPRLRGSGCLDVELLRHVVDVPLRMFPVNVADRVAAAVAVDRLRDRPPQPKEIPDLLVRSDEAI